MPRPETWPRPGQHQSIFEMGGCPEISLVRRELVKMPAQFPGYIGNKDDGTTAVMVSLAVTV